MSDNQPPEIDPMQTQALMALCASVLPVWARQLAGSRSQSETAVIEMLSAFKEIGPHLDRAARQSHQITEALAQGSGGVRQLAQACEAELAPVLGGLDPAATTAVQKVIAMIHGTVGALEQIAVPFEHETQMVSQQVERMYKGFQYQDRISQMMTLLHDDIARLQAAMTSGTADLDAGAWLARLESQYVMQEQHSHHNDTSGGDVADDDATFF